MKKLIPAIFALLLVVLAPATAGAEEMPTDAEETVVEDNDDPYAEEAPEEVEETPEAAPEEEAVEEVIETTEEEVIVEIAEAVSIEADDSSSSSGRTTLASQDCKSDIDHSAHWVPGGNHSITITIVMERDGVISGSVSHYDGHVNRLEWNQGQNAESVTVLLNGEVIGSLADLPNNVSFTEAFTTAISETVPAGTHTVTITGGGDSQFVEACLTSVLDPEPTPAPIAMIDACVNGAVESIPEDTFSESSGHTPAPCPQPEPEPVAMMAVCIDNELQEISEDQLGDLQPFDESSETCEKVVVVVQNTPTAAVAVPQPIEVAELALTGPNALTGALTALGAVLLLSGKLMTRRSNSSELERDIASFE